MLSPAKIQYAGKTNLSFPGLNLLCDVSFDEDNGEINSGLNRELIYSESYNGRIRRASGARYNETFAPKFTLIKEDYSDLNLIEQRAILSWLTSKNNASYLDVYDDKNSNAIVYSILGLPLEISPYKLTNNRTVGITFTFESVAPWAFSPIKTLTQTVTTPATISINCGSDELQSLVYPKITITENGKVVDMDSVTFFNNNYVDGTVYKYNNQYYWKKNGQTYNAQASDTSGITTTGVYIANTTTGVAATCVGNNGTSEIITIDGANKVISSSDTTRIFGDDFNFNWLGLQPGTNSIKVVGNCTVAMEWREPIKTGELI